MQRKRRILYQVCGIFLGISCILSGCHKEEETFTKVTSVQESEDNGENVKKNASKEDIKKPDVESAESDAESQQAGSIWVYICGEVASPGVYELREGDRITHAVEAAGGLTDNAGRIWLNQAEKLTDGQKIYVPSKEEEETYKMEAPAQDTTTAQTAGDTGKININTATKEELLKLNGIGESRAEAILAYRQENGRFDNTEDLKKVDGIKDGIFQKLRDQITVE